MAETALLLAMPGAPNVRHAFAFAEQARLGERLLVLTEHPERLPLGVGRGWLGLNDVEALRKVLAELGSPRILLWGFEPRDVLPLGLVVELANRMVPAIDRIVQDGEELELQPHRPLAHITSTTLSVFPGPMVPLSLGSHQRGFHLLAALNREGCYTDALVAVAKDKWKPVEALLAQIAPRAIRFRPARRKLPNLLRARRGLEMAFRLLLGEDEAAPDLFEERLHTRTSYSGQKTLRRLLERDIYRQVIVAYAWMEPIRDRVPAAYASKVTWICDTYDVQFVRGATANIGEARLAVSDARERRIELDVLSRFDKVVAISKADLDDLRACMPPEKVILAPSGFDYALTEPAPIDVEAPRFGFIGGKMAANVKAVELMIEQWWPAIQRRWPRAKLYLAGSICHVDRVRELTFMRPGVVSLGFVEALEDFYRGIDVSLNPVVVRGGLNFKSVEALMACKLLVTTEVGALCLADPELCLVGDDPDRLVADLEAELASADTFRRKALARRRRSLAQFSDAMAYRDLVKELKRLAVQVIGERIPISGQVSPQRVLIQCGDHLENRIRVLSLAQGIKANGHFPVVLVYERQYVDYFLAKGIDAIAMHDFDESPVELARRRVVARKLKKMSSLYRGFDLDDLTAIDQSRTPERFKPDVVNEMLDIATRHVDRMLRVIEHVAPDRIFVWNGYTGFVANTLRQYVESKALPAGYLERALFKDAVFVDERGTNGNAALARLSKQQIECHPCARQPAARPREDLIPPVDETVLKELRNAGPWRGKKIVFVPLQVQKDTNIIQHSPRIKTMKAFVQAVYDEFHEEDVAIIVRPHPEEVERNLGLPELPGLHVDASGELATWLDIADRVVTINSTVGLEAALRHKPVMTMGRSIYSDKGITDLDGPPNPATVEAYYRYLVSEHTCLPERPAGILSKLTPRVTAPAELEPRNFYKLNVREAQQSWATTRAAIARAAQETGQLFLLVTLDPQSTLNFTYRKRKEPVTPEWLAERTRDEFQLAEEVEILFGRELPDELPGDVPIVQVGSAPLMPHHRASCFVDRYVVPMLELNRLTVADRHEGLTA